MSRAMSSRERMLAALRRHGPAHSGVGLSNFLTVTEFGGCLFQVTQDELGVT
jgi:hypothetical protein